MRVEVTEQGLVIPKEFLEGIQAVEIHKQGDRLILVRAIFDESTSDLGSATAQVSESQEPVTDIPKSPLGQRLREIRAKIVASGEPLLSIQEIEQEISEQRNRLGYLDE